MIPYRETHNKKGEGGEGTENYHNNNNNKCCNFVWRDADAGACTTAFAKQ
jgi:hypothetical protein